MTFGSFTTATVLTETLSSTGGTGHETISNTANGTTTTCAYDLTIGKR
jgi:hypothetical protein